MEISLTKSKYLSARSGKTDDPAKAIIPLEGVAAMTYLGSEINFNPRARYLDKFSEMTVTKSERYNKSIWALSNSSADPTVFAERLWVSTALPSILYSSEVLLIRAADLVKCEQAQDSLAKFILQVPDTTCNASTQLAAGP